MAKTADESDVIEIPVLRGQLLGVKVYRGYARLCDLARVSRADIYDQQNNPNGTQRDLSPKHASDAYTYITTRDFAFWPEVFLCARDRKVLKFEPAPAVEQFGVLRIDALRVLKAKTIAISRVDGNHRLHYADGTQPGFSAVEKVVSFCMAYDLTLEQEITLFRDINANQKAMNTSHLDNIEARLTPEEELKRDSPAVYIAQRLGRDEHSPLRGRVFEGGRKAPGPSIPLHTLSTGIEYMRSRSAKLTSVRDMEAQYKLVRNYFRALHDWQPKAWQEPAKYLLLRGSGLWAACFVGADVISRVLDQNKFSARDMLAVLKSGEEWDWSTKGPFKGLGGRGGAVEICEMITSVFKDASGRSNKDLWKKIVDEG